MKKNVGELPKLPVDGKLYHNQALDTIEALIPTSFTSNHACDLLELPNGDLLCVWFAGSDEGNADISIVLSRLNHDSSQWTDAVSLTNDPERSDQNPSLFLSSDHEIWLMHTSQLARPPMDQSEFNLQYTSKICRRISTDNGYTWSDSDVMFDRPGSFCRQKIQVLSNNRWLFENWICFNDDTRNGSDITVVHRSDDNGKSWQTVEIPNSRGRVHANVLEMGDGKLVALFRSRAADWIYRSVSEDNGISWTEPVSISVPNNNSSISAIRLDSGRIAMAYNDFQANDASDITVWPYDRIPVTVAISEDEGLSWPYQRIVEWGEGFCGEKNRSQNSRYEYPCLMQSKDKRLHLAYSFGNRICMKYVSFTEEWITGDNLKGGL